MSSSARRPPPNAAPKVVLPAPSSARTARDRETRARACLYAARLYTTPLISALACEFLVNRARAQAQGMVAVLTRFDCLVVRARALAVGRAVATIVLCVVLAIGSLVGGCYAGKTVAARPSSLSFLHAAPLPSAAPALCCTTPLPPRRRHALSTLICCRGVRMGCWQGVADEAAHTLVSSVSNCLPSRVGAGRQAGDDTSNIYTQT